MWYEHTRKGCKGSSWDGGEQQGREQRRTIRTKYAWACHKETCYLVSKTYKQWTNNTTLKDHFSNCGLFSYTWIFSGNRFSKNLCLPVCMNSSNASVHKFYWALHTGYQDQLKSHFQKKKYLIERADIFRVKIMSNIFLDSILLLSWTRYFKETNSIYISIYKLKIHTSKCRLGWTQLWNAGI